MFYNELSKDFPDYTMLPIAEIPEAVRVSDGLINQPHYRLNQK